MTEPLEDHKIVPENEWVESRKALLKKEKEFTIFRDQLSQQRRNLPWVAVNKEYPFESQVLVSHAMIKGKNRIKNIL
jgi:predicted dithiol-disulfide oxidoreductase (DUF899 family)